jgi:hypothetical protein
MTIDKFDHNSTLVNYKLKPYRFIKHQTLQLVLVKPYDFLSEKPIEVKYFDNMPNQQ